jgi:hypothetical protein
MLRDALIPWPIRLAIHEKEALPEDAPEDAEPSATPAAVAYVKYMRIYPHILTLLQRTQGSHAREDDRQEARVNSKTIPFLLLRGG